MSLKMRPIGYVITDASHEELRHGSAVSKIVIDRKFSRGLQGLEDFSHFYVLFFLHRMPKRSFFPRVNPQGRADIKKVGIFATRSPHRPNPIGLTLVKLLKKRGRVLTVKGLDAYDGTPVLDIKPHDRRDSTPRPRAPRWWRKLERENRAALHARHSSQSGWVH
jgi:tRNA-Thr(GGU) m(6)t(6)A37 methyltransferase TsaA